MKPVTLRFLIMEYRLALKNFRRLLVGVFFFSLLLLCMLSLLFVSLQSNGTVSITRIAIVNEDTSSASSLALSYIEDFRSTSAFFTFVETSSKEADRMLAAGEVTAVITIPADTIDSILSGENIPVTVSFSNTDSLPQALLTELIRSGVSLLASAQSAIYTTADLYEKYSLSMELGSVFDLLNTRNLKLALLRENLFTGQNVSMTGPVRLSVFYGASLFFLFFIICGTLYAPQFAESTSLRQIQSHMGLSAFSHCLIRFLVLFTQNLFLFFFLFLLVTHGPFRSLYPDARPLFTALTASLGPLCFLSSWEAFFFTLFSRQTDRVLWLFFISLLLLFFSGSLLPAAFFPSHLKQLTQAFPAYWCQRIWMQTLDTTFLPDSPYTLFCLAASMFLFAAMTVTDHWKRRYCL